MVGHIAPSSELVNEALRRIPTQPLRRAFFEGLMNPHWVEPLANAGMFTDPPEPDLTDDGLIKDYYWPEIDYLVRVAPEVPTAVVDVLLKLHGSNNAWVRRAIFTIGASIPALEAVRLYPMVKEWRTGGFGWRVDPREMVSFAVRLLEGNRLKAGKGMANLLFRPMKSENTHSPALVLDEYWYHDGLPRVIEALGDEGLKTVLPWLEEYERHSGRLTDEYDMTDMSRESIRERREDHPSVEHSLIDAVRELATRAMARDPRETSAQLGRSPMTLSRKIGLYATTETLRQAGGTIDSATSQVLEVAVEYITDQAFHNDSCLIELCELAREVARHKPSALEPLAEFILTAPAIDREQLRDRLRIDEDDVSKDLDERIDEVLDGWRHRWLSALGYEVLPPALKPLLLELDNKRGIIDSPLAAKTRMVSWSGPNSPISQDEMSVMSPNELVAHLASWQAPTDRWGPSPSHEGQGRELSALIATNPRVVDGVENLIDKLRPIYLRAILQGWGAAIKSEIPLGWRFAADFIYGILTHSNSSSFPQEGDNFDDDADLLGAKKAAVNLLEELVQKRKNLEIPRNELERFALLLINEAGSHDAWERYNSDDTHGDMDPLTLSLNRQWPTRLRGLLNLFLRGKNTSWYTSAKVALEQELELEDRWFASRAIVGQELGQLLTVAPDWIQSRAHDLFGSAECISPCQQVAMTTAMAIHHYHSELYEFLTPAMLSAIRLREPLISGWQSQSDPIQLIGQWAVNAIILGHIDSNDPVVEAFFRTAEPKVRGAAIGRIGWRFVDAKYVDDEIRNRFADLWDARVQHVREHPEDKDELIKFYWLVKSGKFKVSWWLPRLIEALQLNPAVATGRILLGKQLALAADLDPRRALNATQLLVSIGEGHGISEWDIVRNAVPMVIARAITSGDDQLKADAIYFMNRLGESGNPHLESEVNDVLRGRITQDDVDD